MTFSHTRRACYFGYVTQAIVNNLAPVLFVVFQTQYALPLEKLGRLVLLNFSTQLVTDMVAVKYVDRIGYRVPLVLAHILSALGLLLLAVAPALLPSPYVGLCLAVIVYAIGGGLLEVVVSPVVDALPSPATHKAAAMSLLHSFYCWGQVAVVAGTTLLLAAMGHGGWQLLPALWATVPLVNLFIFLKVPMPAIVPDAHRTRLRDLFKAPAFTLALLLMLCTGAAELTMAQWSSLFAEEGLGLPKVYGDLAGPCLFAVLMGIGRIFYGMYGQRIALLPAITGCGILATACYLTAALSPHALISLLGCAFCGLAVSLLWPGTFSLTSARFPFGGAAMFGTLAVFGDAGGALGPWLTGAIADAASRSSPALPAHGLRTGILVGTLFPLLIIATAILLARLRPSPAPSNMQISAPTLEPDE